MNPSTCRILFLWCLLLKICMLISQSTLAEACENSLNLKECVDPAMYKELWTRINNEKCGSKQGTVIHCQKMWNGNICSLCASSKICDRGTRAHLDTVTKTVSCVSCEQDWFQKTDKHSYLFRTPSCGSQHMGCSDGKFLCSEGTATQDNKCQCDYEAGYKPHPEDCLCFDFHSNNCGCEKANCPGGVDSKYKCIPVTTTVKPETTETTTSISVIGETSDQDTSGLPVWAIIVIVIAIIGLPAIVIGITYRCCWEKFKERFCRRCRGSKKDESGPESSPMLDSVENGRTPSSEINSSQTVSNGTSHRNEAKAEVKGPIIVTTEETNDVTAKMVTGLGDCDVVREAAQHKVNEQKLKVELLNKPTKVEFHGTGHVNMMLGDHGTINQTVDPASYSRRESSDMSSLDDDSEDAQRNEPGNNLTEDGEQQTTNQREGDQPATNQREGDQPATNQNQGEQQTENHLGGNDMEQTMVKRVDAEQTMVIRVDPEQTMVKRVDPEQTMVIRVDPEQTMVKRVDPEQTMVKTVDPEQTMVIRVDPEQTMVKTVDPEQTMVKRVDPEQTMVKRVEVV